MTDERFTIRRADGRSDAQVIIDLVARRKPGDTLSFDELIAELSKGCERAFSQQEARQAIYRSERRMLSEQSRAMMSVRGYGYKVAFASEHDLIARNRKARSDHLLRKGLHVLRNVRWDEMSQNERAAHEGALMLLSGIMAAQEAMSARQDRMEQRIRETLGL